MPSLDLDAIRVDGGTQPRAIIDMAVVEDYAQAIGDGAKLPPVTAFYDGSEYWLADGFHRWHAHKALGLAEIETDVHQGTRRDAVLFSVGANAAHGLRRSNEDKRRAVLTLLNDPEWAQWSDREIARRCGVAHPFVGKLRPSPEPRADTGNGYQYEAAGRTFVHPKTGQPTQMRTGNIGSNPKPRPPAEAVFDNTPSGQQPTPVEPEVYKRDTSNDWLIHPIFGLLDSIEQLPPAAEAAGRFPWEMANNLSTERVSRAIAWLEEFRDAWADREPDVRRRLQIILHGEAA